MESNFECPICSEVFNKNLRVPLVLLCGHTVCKKCVNDLFSIKKTIICPLDRKTDSRQISQISFSYTILELIDKVTLMTSKIKILSLPPEQRILAMKSCIQEKIEKISEQTNKIQEKVKECITMKNTVLDKIDLAFRELYLKLNIRQRELKSEVEEQIESIQSKFISCEKILNSMKEATENELENINNIQTNINESIFCYNLPEVPEVNAKIKFTGNSESLVESIQDFGMIRNMITVVPFNCEHFTNITYWMVPPCCNKYYCCNKCHDKKESHTWIYANKMVCAYCEGEQDYRKLPNNCEFCGNYHKGVISRN
ncbi:hypothetical protein SteCoe_36446 [Stentor coeruleus]|uniref:RING-type domain-containing protein n=1 Tax=Stentor coeruleus TaxID=5963 RepID=A0A1R2AQ77_9CILI|nr:hypothetical protein SteCoe_36446 [Stentor coeruleus]